MTTREMATRYTDSDLADTQELAAVDFDWDGYYASLPPSYTPPNHEGVSTRRPTVTMEVL